MRTKKGYQSEGITGYCFPDVYPWKAGTVPLYRYWQPVWKNNFYTTDIGEIGQNFNQPGQVGKLGYIYEGVTCRVYPEYR